MGNFVSYKNCQFFIKIMLSACFLVFMTALKSIACGGHDAGLVFASELLVVPAIGSLYPYGIPLLTLISIESFILHKRESISWIRSFYIAACANVFHLICSVLNAIFLSVFLPSVLILPILYAAMCLSFCQRPVSLKFLSKKMFIFFVYLLFIGLGFTTLFLINFIQVSASNNFIFGGTVGLLLTGFIFGFVAKGFAIGRILAEKRPSLAATVMSMHVGSFVIIPIGYYLIQSR